MAKRKVPESQPKHSGIEAPNSDREKLPFRDTSVSWVADTPLRKSKRWKKLGLTPRHARHLERVPKEIVYRDSGAKTENWGVAKIGAILGLPNKLEEEAELVSLVEYGLSVSSISALIQHGILEKEIYGVIVPRRTLQHRRSRKEKLSREESDRAIRLARLVTLAEEVFGARDVEDLSEARDAGMRWLRAPKKRFRGRIPMEMIATETGGRLVEEALYQIDEGMAA
ncbi:MAG TPA: antitoxin Xre/MbcA/ParS toxin-binding domain-containing protein [Candidatus Angelobacter sp.]